MDHKSNTVQAAPLMMKPKAFFVGPTVHLRLKRFVAIANNTTMQKAAEEAVNEWIDRKEKELAQ